MHSHSAGFRLCVFSSEITKILNSCTIFLNLDILLSRSCLSATQPTSRSSMLLLLLTSPHFSSSFFGAKWTELKDKDLACSSGEYKGELGCGGPCTSAEFCATAAETATSLAINYAVWRGDSDKGCYVCDLSDRGDPSKWAWSAQPGAVSFYTSTPAPSPAGRPSRRAVQATAGR